MEERKNRTETTEFVSKSRPEHRAHSRSRGYSYVKKGISAARKKSDSMPKFYKNLARNTFICAVIALSLIGIKQIDSDVTNEFINGISGAVNSELVMDKDIGKLKFVNANTVSYSVPMEGEVVSTFSETGKSVSIKGEDYSVVNAMLSGKVKETGENYVVVENVNGTVSTYTGIIPCVIVGDTVINSDPIGELTADTLILETSKDDKYLDSLSMKAMTSEIE